MWKFNLYIGIYIFKIDTLIIREKRNSLKHTSLTNLVEYTVSYIYLSIIQIQNIIEFSFKNHKNDKFSLYKAKIVCQNYISLLLY